jgi:hypothetical protein
VAAGEAGGSRDRGRDRIDELERRGEVAPAYDLARDAVGVALLAEVAQQAGELPRLPGVDDLGGGQLLRRVHAHVERRVVGVGEAALARVHLHGGHAEVEVDQVRLQVLLQEPVEAGGEVGAHEARAARHVRRQLGEGGFRERVAVDADQQAGRAEPPRDEAGVAGGADGAVDRDLARLRIERLDQLAGEDRDVGAGHVKQDGQERR